MTSTSKRIRFRSTRGRPKSEASAQHGPDLGTPELILKHAYRHTAEPIDLCLERNIITEQEHRSAMHLRWLHTIRYGAPGISALDLSRGAGCEIPLEDDSAWRQNREYDYAQAMQLLHERDYESLIIPCVIYNEKPDFLQINQYEKAFSCAAKLDQLMRQSARFAEGLSTLTTLWKR
jgi:hypothetical protein